MKRLIIEMAAIIGVAVLFASADFSPDPVTEKPVLAKPAEAWMINKTLVAYYQKVKLPDGSNVELKSKVLLTDKQWQAKADAFWEAQKKAELEKPKICPYCGRPI